MRVRRVPEIGVKLHNCGRCGFPEEEPRMRKQKGYWVHYPRCYDEPTRVTRRTPTKI